MTSLQAAIKESKGLNITNSVQFLGDVRQGCKTTSVLFCFKWTAVFHCKQGSYRVLNSWKSLEICKPVFQIWKKSGKSLDFFCFENCNKRLIAKWNFFQAVKSYFISPVFSENIQSQTEKSQNSLTLASHELSYSFFQGERRRAEVHTGRKK